MKRYVNSILVIIVLAIMLSATYGLKPSTEKQSVKSIAVQDPVKRDTAKKAIAISVPDRNIDNKEKEYLEFKSVQIRQEKNLQKLDSQSVMLDSLIMKNQKMKKK